MITPFEVYLIMSMDNFCALFEVVGFALIGVAIFFLCIIHDHDCNEKCSFGKYGFGILFGALLILTGALMPSRDTAIAMYVIPKLAQSQTIQQIPAYLQEYIKKELSPSKDD